MKIIQLRTDGCKTVSHVDKLIYVLLFLYVGYFKIRIFIILVLSLLLLLFIYLAKPKSGAPQLLLIVSV